MPSFLELELDVVEELGISPAEFSSSSKLTDDVFDDERAMERERYREEDRLRQIAEAPWEMEHWSFLSLSSLLDGRFELEVSWVV
jgi:hypothetical protein